MIARNRARDDTRRVGEPALSFPGRPVSYEYDDRYGRGGPSLAPPGAAYARGYENPLAASVPGHPSSYGGYSAPTRSAPPGPTPLLSLSTGSYPPSFPSLPASRSLGSVGPSPYFSSDPYAGRPALYPRDRYSIERERERDRDRELWERRMMRFSPERFREREREFRPNSRERLRDVYADDTHLILQL